MSDRRVPRWVFWILLAIHGVASVPLCVTLAAFVPRFADLFARLAERGKLPPLTQWVLLLSNYWVWLFLFGFALDSAILYRLSRLPRDPWLLTLAWFVAALVAIVALLYLTVWALLLPVHEMPATV